LRVISPDRLFRAGGSPAFWLVKLSTRQATPRRRLGELPQA